MTVSMHLLVLSAFRQIRKLVERRRVGVSMHLLVLSAFRLINTNAWETHNESGLNAPFGAQCFPTGRWQVRCTTRAGCLNAPFGAQCFPTGWSLPRSSPITSLNAPFGAQCFPTCLFGRRGIPLPVSMHLLVLSAFRLFNRIGGSIAKSRLNAPFGAQCFPTRLLIGWLSGGKTCLNAPFGAQCFPTRLQKAASQRRFPGRKRRRPGKHQIESARTAPIKPHNPRKPPQIDPAPPTSPTHRYATGFQRTYTKRSEPRDSATGNTATKASVDYPSRRRDGPFSANRRFANRRFPVPVALPPAATSRSAVFRQPPHSGSAAGRSGAATVDKGRTEAGKNGQGQNRSRQKRTGWNRSQQTG